MKNIKWIVGLRKWMGRLMVRRMAIVTPSGEISRFYQSNRWAILVNITSEAVYDAVIAYGKLLKSEGKKVMILGYIAPESLQFTPMKTVDFDYLTPDDLSFTWLPQSVVSTEFCQRDFDILLVFNSELNIPIEAIARKSNARLKVCAGAQDQAYCQLHIKLDDSASIDESLKHITHYLKMMDYTPNNT